MEAEFSQDGKTLSIASPPNNRVFPPGPGKFSTSSGVIAHKLNQHRCSLYILDGQ